MADQPTVPFADIALDRKSRDRVVACLNHLTESTFFYPEDEPDIFQFLRRNQAGFRQILESWFGWRLYVDEQVARIIKERQYTQHLKHDARALFDLRRRDECLLFALLIEFHELERQRQGLAPDDDRMLRFLYADFLDFAVQRAKEELANDAPAPEALHAAAKPLFEQLSTHRFIRFIKSEPRDADEHIILDLEEQLLYEFRPGIRCYDPSKMARTIILDVLKKKTAPDDADAEPQEAPR